MLHTKEATTVFELEDPLTRRLTDQSRINSATKYVRCSPTASSQMVGLYVCALSPTNRPNTRIKSTVEDIYDQTVPRLRARDGDRARKIVNLGKIDVHDVVARVVVPDLGPGPVCSLVYDELILSGRAGRNRTHRHTGP